MSLFLYSTDNYGTVVPLSTFPCHDGLAPAIYTLSVVAAPSNAPTRRSYIDVYTVDSTACNWRFFPTSLKPIDNARVHASPFSFAIVIHHRDKVNADIQPLALLRSTFTMGACSHLSLRRYHSGSVYAFSVFPTRWQKVTPPKSQPRPASITLRT